jgi:phage shock protein PspC (stress-responsive transcriptional regulator)
MNKTVTINISGIIFHIEEDAFDSLSKYLSTIKGYFSKTDGGNEVMSDIEARIAELLQTKINATKQVILMVDVDYVMGVMGKPEDFGAEQSKDESGNEDEQPNYTQEKIRRRLYRNPDEKAIGGVCSGLAAYFDIDTVWIRLAMFLLIFFGGVSIWVYIILWIVIPEAKTTADRLAMRGESANINSIYKTFKEEAEDFKNRAHKSFKDGTDDVKNRMNQYSREFRNQNYGESVRSNLSSVLKTFFNILGRLIGLFLIIVGGILLFAYVMSLLGISVLNSNNDVAHWRHVIFESHSDYILGVFAFIIVVGIPVIMMVYAGVKLLFKIKYHNRWMNLGLGILWALGLILGFYVTVSTVKQFNQSARLKESFTLRGMGDTVIIKMNPGVNIVKSMNFENMDDVETYMSHNHGGYFFRENGSKLAIIGYAGLNVLENNSDSVEMTISRTARGKTKKEANENARAMTYSYHQNGHELVFDEIFAAAEGYKFRAQELEIKIYVPKGKVVYFDKNTKYLLDDVDNTTNTWDGDMVGRRWKMTERGLKCIDCEDLQDIHHRFDPEHEDHFNKKGKITINDDGISVNGDETDIKIDDDGISIKTPGNDIELKSDSKKEKGKKENKH